MNYIISGSLFPLIFVYILFAFNYFFNSSIKSYLLFRFIMAASIVSLIPIFITMVILVIGKLFNKNGKYIFKIQGTKMLLGTVISSVILNYSIDNYLLKASSISNQFIYPGYLLIASVLVTVCYVGNLLIFSTIEQSGSPNSI